MMDSKLREKLIKRNEKLPVLARGGHGLFGVYSAQRHARYVLEDLDTPENVEALIWCAEQTQTFIKLLPEDYWKFGDEDDHIDIFRSVRPGRKSMKGHRLSFWSVWYEFNTILAQKVLCGSASEAEQRQLHSFLTAWDKHIRARHERVAA